MSRESFLSRAISRGLLVLFALVLLEGGAFLAVKVLETAHATRFLLYTPPKISEEEYADYLRRRDPRLGFPSPDVLGGDRYDRSGSRHIPAFPQPGGECASLYGDSFTFSADVSHEDAWSNVLSQKLGCRAANYGVSGYGTDQAYLRFEYNENDAAKITILGFYPRDVMRNVTQYQHFESGDSPVSFKPRFVLEEGQLKLIQLPHISRETLAAFGRSPERFLLHETFLPDAPLGPSRPSFPYTLVLLKAAGNDRILNAIRRRPMWMSFLEPGHPSQGLEITAAIMQKFDALCRDRGKRCFVLLFPTSSSCEYYRRTGKEAVQPLIDALERANVDFLNLTPGMVRYLGDRSYCEILGDPKTCDGHHNPEGDRLTAELIYEKILGNDLTDPH